MWPELGVLNLVTQEMGAEDGSFCLVASSLTMEN